MDVCPLIWRVPEPVFNTSHVTPDITGLVHERDRGVQNLSIHYSERLGQASVVSLVGSRGDSYDDEHNIRVTLPRSDSRYDWPECPGVDLSASVGWRSTRPFPT